MAYLPCLNPNCKSHGKPHPNCRCYDGGTEHFADGGIAGHFCSDSRAHKPDCEYFKDGGEVQPMGQTLQWLPSDPQEAVASSLMHSGATHLLDGTLHGAYADQNSGLRALDNKKISQKLQEHLIAPTQSHDKMAAKLGNKHTSSKFAAPILMHMSMNGKHDGFHNILSYAHGVSKGSKRIDSAIDGLFGGEDKAGVLSAGSKDEEGRKRLDSFIKSGALQDQITRAGPQPFAEGGVVKNEKSIFSGTSPMEEHLPAHNMLIQQAKGRINNYLNSLRPTDGPPTLPFDSKSKDHMKKMSYEKALDLANHPADILGQVKRGTITPEALGHFKGLYPEVHDHLSKKMTERIVQSQLEDSPKPPYHVRQAMSLFLGAPMDSTFTPASIQAAQATFILQKPQGQEAQPQKEHKKSGSKAALKDAPKALLTPDQSALVRQQRAR